MALSDSPPSLQGRRVAIWGVGKEGREAARLLNSAPFVFLDDTMDGPAEVEGHTVWRGSPGIAEALRGVDVLIKSPGVSLYRPEIAAFTARGGCVTSLLNLWSEVRKDGAMTIAVTGTKGKSTTSALLAHVLTALGRKARAVGNIGVPVTEINIGRDSCKDSCDVLVLELSSYQTADFAGRCDLGLVTSLYPEHLNWHGDLATYYRDKLALLARAEIPFCHEQVKAAAPPGALPASVRVYGSAGGVIPNPYLARAHNRANVGGVLAVVAHLGLSQGEARESLRTFVGLPHRQQELGVRAGVLYVDDSIATTPQAAIAAMEAYPHRPVTLIAGGFDRGIDYQPLIEYVLARREVRVVCLGPSGERICVGLAQAGHPDARQVADMGEAVHTAQDATPSGGVILLSPAAPSFGLFRDYQERGEAFARCSGFVTTPDPQAGSKPTVPPPIPA